MESIESQHADVMEKLRELQQDRAFCDFTLHLKEGPLRFSRVLLASMSPFFRKLVTVDMEETRSGEVLMLHVTQDTWNCITSFYFSSQMLVSIHNVQDVLEASHMYGLEKLVQYCGQFLQSHCCADNCFELLKLAAHFELESLAEEARRVLADNFSTLYKCEVFFRLEKAHLLKLLEEEVETTEDDLCQALLAWMEKNNADADTCTEVFQELRLNLISDECLGSFVICHNVCIGSQPIQSLVTRERTRRMQSTTKRQTQIKARKRCPRSAKNSLFVLGESWTGLILVFVWSLKEKKWTQLPGLPRLAGEVFSCTALEDTVVVTGGTKNQGSHLFDLETRLWSPGPDLLQRRQFPGMTTIRDTAYVVGGFDDVGALSSIEEYSEASGQWTSTGDLQEATGHCGVAALGDTILVVGGNTDEAAWLIQTFNVYTREAAVLDIRLPRAMWHVRAASHGTSAFFVGEKGDLVQVREVEEKLNITSHEVLENYDPDNVWFGLQVSKNCVRSVGSFLSGTVSCWDFTGKQFSNDDIEDLPQQMACCFALEVNIPSR